MLYIIGLGLDLDSVSKKSLEVLKNCSKVYLEDYTVEFPYSFEDLEKSLSLGKDKKIFPANRAFVESLEVVKEAKRNDVALLVYGSPLTATTHITVIEECRNKKVNFQVLHNASVIDAVAETGLQLYKFGKIASMPKWDEKKKFVPDSFMEIVKSNQRVSAHSLILVDIGLEFPDAIKELERSAKNQKAKIEEIVVCSRLGTKEEKIFYGKTRLFSDLKRFPGENLKAPFCIIIPGKLHFLEEEVLKRFKL